MKFTGQNQDFKFSTFNDNSNSVIQNLTEKGQLTELDHQMFEAILKFSKTDNIKKELIQAIEEIKSQKTDIEKSPFRNKIVAFLKENKEVFKTILKIGASAVIAHYGLQGADNLLGLSD